MQDGAENYAETPLQLASAAGNIYGFIYECMFFFTLVLHRFMKCYQGLNIVLTLHLYCTYIIHCISLNHVTATNLICKVSASQLANVIILLHDLITSHDPKRSFYVKMPSVKSYALLDTCHSATWQQLF